MVHKSTWPGTRYFVIFVRGPKINPVTSDKFLDYTGTVLIPCKQKYQVSQKRVCRKKDRVHGTGTFLYWLPGTVAGNERFSHLVLSLAALPNGRACGPSH